MEKTNNENRDSNEMSFERVQNICYDIARKVCGDSQASIENACQYKRDNIISQTAVRLGEISAGIATLCASFDSHLKLHERSEAFWKWFALFLVVLVGASNYIPKIFQ